jgi:hypothetical protein
MFMHRQVLIDAFEPSIAIFLLGGTVSQLPVTSLSGMKF